MLVEISKGVQTQRHYYYIQKGITSTATSNFVHYNASKSPALNIAPLTHVTNSKCQVDQTSSQLIHNTVFKHVI